MKTRIIQTRFWDDEFVSELDIYTQHLYIYLLTSQYINISGIFQLPVKKIQFECKLTDKQFNDAKQILESHKKVFFYKGWVFIINALKNNKYTKSTDNYKAYEKELSQVPKEIKDFFDSSVNSTVDSSLYSTNKQETRNKKPEKDLVKTKSNSTAPKSYKLLSDLGEEEFKRIADKYSVQVKLVADIFDELEIYCQSKGKHYNDYFATLMGWVRRKVSEKPELRNLMKPITSKEMEALRLSNDKQKFINYLTEHGFDTSTLRRN